MKSFFFGFLAIFFLFFNIIPCLHIFADDNSGYTDSQYADIGTLMLTSLISSGEATELDFSDYTENDSLDWLISFGELAVTGDPTGLIEQGMDWLGGELSDTYNELIEDIREWQHEIAPDLYDLWFNGSKYEFKLVQNQNISKPLLKLLTPDHSDDSPIIPSDLQTYLDIINKRDYNDVRTFWFWETNPSSDAYRDNIMVSDRSWFTPGNNLINLSGKDNSLLCFKNNIQNIYINSINDTYNCSFYWSNDSIRSPSYGGTFWWGRTPQTVNGIDYLQYRTSSSSYFLNFSHSGSLNQIFNALKDHVKNVNIYVDNELWASVGSSSPSYPIVIPNQLTVLNDLPAVYDFPTPTYYNLNGLKTLLVNAINSSNIVTWQDIDDYFVDINGVQALPVVQIYRNDYDNMYIEQYPYPAKLIGMQDPLTFNEHLLDNQYGQYIRPIVNVADNTLDVLPSEIKWVLGIGVILSIFALIINRLLE